MKKKLATLMMAGLIAAVMCTPAMAASEMSEDSAGNVCISGDAVSLPASRFFSAFAAGQSVEMKDSDAIGSAFIAGQQAAVSDSEVGESLYAAGNQVTIDDTIVSGNILAAGNVVEVTGNSEANAVYAVGSTVTFEGEANYLYVAASNAVISGTINGDAKIEADNIEIKDGTVITGELIIESAVEPSLSEKVSVGDYSFDQVTKEDSSDNTSIGQILIGKITSGLYWIVAMGAFGMVLCWLFNEHLARAGRYIKNRPTPMVVSGILTWLFVPLAALLMAVSYILAPIAGMLSIAYVLLLCAGLAFAGASIGRLVFPNMNVFLSALIGIAVLEVLRLIPVIGFIIGCAADMYLLGYIVQYLWLHRLQKVEKTEE